MQDFSLTKWVDAASPNLLDACATGEHIPLATITVRHAGEDAQEYLVIELFNVVVESFTTQGASDDEGRPTEELTFSFEKVSWEYRPVQPTQRATPSFYSSTPYPQ